jgi:hypothetical protein
MVFELLKHNGLLKEYSKTYNNPELMNIDFIE